MNNQNSTSNIAIIILAAGSSSRLGKPKQLIHYQKETLIKKVVKTASQLSAENIFVVTGFLHQELIAELQGFPIHFAPNPNWTEGMGSSIQTGINAVLESKNSAQIDCAMFLLSDQPLIDTAFLKHLINQFYTDKNSKIAATNYAGTQGVPAVFDKSLFPVLQQLSGKSGANSIFKKYEQQLLTVPFEAAAIDIDTEEDYLRLLDSDKNQLQ
ncbi:MAG: nucleotidyltransferase family protein [Janthinobacterium lividum]